MSNRQSSDDASRSTRSHLTPGLLAPSTVVGLFLMAATLLPMTSCNAKPLVPFEVATEGIVNVLDSRTMPEAANRSANQFFFLFLLTWPYWTPVPAFVAFPLAHRMPRLAHALWRGTTCALCLFVIALTFDSRLLPIPVMLAAALLVLIRSSPMLLWVWRQARHHLFGTDDRWANHVDPTKCGFIAQSIICFTFALVLVMDEHLLIGGILAAVANTTLGFVSLGSARQSQKERSQWPKFYLRDALIVLAAYGVLFFALAHYNKPDDHHSTRVSIVFESETLQVESPHQ